jgi:hypothetical protein
MTPIKFPQANITIAENQPEYFPLPALVTQEGMVITAWVLSDVEVNMLAETRLLWLKMLTFGQPLQPIMPQTENPFEEVKPEVLHYRHYKGGVYRFVSEATFVDTKALVIVYQCLASGKLYVRDKVEFHEQVELPDGRKVPRFERM